jgi:nicotinamidase-related amidase
MPDGTRWLCALAVLFIAAGRVGAEEPKAAAKPADTLRLNLRARAEIFKGQGPAEVTSTLEVPADKVAIVICDMWDDHWCKSAAKRCGEMAERMAPVVEAARKRGVRIIHAPSDCMDFYKDAPQRKRMADLPKPELPKPLDLPDPPLPVDSTDGGCDDDPPSPFRKAWTRQHTALRIADEDGITDKGDEVYAFIKKEGITHLIVMGVHTNMCVLHRTFAIKRMTRLGVKCLLVRDMTDSMYNPKRSPQVSHDEGTNLIIGHIETHWCPTILSKDLLGK